ncbi:MAG TPA: nucleotide exchange factor GrpE [Puia sp.]|jgi:molecular chaperone GrpE|nr:nucleotide exchange factor GrpE [Puia sp.]
MPKNTDNLREEKGFDAVSNSESMVDINTDENVAGTNNLNQNLEEDDLVEKLKADIQDQKDKYLRLLAEFDNYKRRSSRERLELSQTAGKEIIVSLLDVLDDCDRAEKQLQQGKNTEDLSGVLLVFNKLRTILQNRGLKPMESIHEVFDVEKHEAVSEVPAPSPDLKGKVVAEVMRGYYLNDKIIRFAKVIVGK